MTPTFYKSTKNREFKLYFSLMEQIKINSKYNFSCECDTQLAIQLNNKILNLIKNYVHLLLQCYWYRLKHTLFQLDILDQKQSTSFDKNIQT